MQIQIFRTRTLLSALVPALYLVVVLLFDWAEPYRTVTPPLFTIGLLCMAALLQPWWMVWWAAVYSTIVMEVLLNPRIFQILSNGYRPPEITSHKFRVVGFMATAFFCCVFSWLLTRLRNKRESLNHLIARMPLPVAVSDASGRILLLNDLAREILSINAGDKLGFRSFFDLFAPAGRQGECISIYIRIFKKEAAAPDTMNLEVNGRPYVGLVELMDTRPRQMIVMLSEANR